MMSITTSPQPATSISSASTQIHFRGLMPSFMAWATSLGSTASAVRTITREKAMELIIGSKNAACFN